MSDRGVSEVLGFVLVFALVTSTIGVVYATGFTGLANVQDAEQLTNMERAFDVLDDNIADLHRRGAPSRATELRLAGGAVGTGDPVDLTVFVVNTTNSSRNETYLMTANPIVYEDGDGTEIVYSMGAVLRAQNGRSVMLSEPNWINDSSRAVIPFIVTFPRTANEQIGGETKLLLVTRRSGGSLKEPILADNGASLRVNVTIDSPRAEAWDRYLDDRGFTPLPGNDPSNGVVKYQFFTDGVYVPQTSIEIDIER